MPKNHSRILGMEDSHALPASLCGQRPPTATILDMVEIKATAPQKKPQAGYTLGVIRSLLPHLGFWAGRQVSGDVCRPTWPNRLGCNNAPRRFNAALGRAP